MPKYTCQPERFKGYEFPPFLPLDVLDADGQVVNPAADVVAFDTESGEVHFMKMVGGNVHVVLKNQVTGEEKEIPKGMKICPLGWEEVLKIYSKFFKAPLSFKEFVQ